MTTMADAGPDPLTSPRPRAATGSGHLLRAELGRLRRRRLVGALLAVGALALLASLTAVYFTHSQDIANARAKAQVQAQRDFAQQKEFRDQCLADPNISDDDKTAGACGPSEPDASIYFSDPRLHADDGLPIISIAVAVAGALLMALVGATAVGADWASRAIVTLITWEPRRLRLYGTRLLAVAILAAVVGVVTQAVGLGLGALAVSQRGTWDPREPSQFGDPALIHQAHFWRDLLSLQGRGVLLVVLTAVLAAAVTMLARHTAALLGLMFAWFVLAENAVRILFGDRGWPRWLLSNNVIAFLKPGGLAMVVGTERQPDGGVLQRTVLVSNLDALAYLGILTAVFVVLAGALLRRRDL
ncbi:hypothetical protein ACPPVT_02615 [Angustibacter sp. McL0619]|uniref:hypothetical protein n=1 Tax=Angustibacter sp. McL0619 TaxID=3415676 RepID=UPI003CF3C68C